MKWGEGLMFKFSKLNKVYNIWFYDNQEVEGGGAEKN